MRKCGTNPPQREAVYLTGFGGVSILADPELLEADHGLEEWELFAGSIYHPARERQEHASSR
jgi:hypothetical protein